MATNKHASIRYQTLDKCFSNFGRKYCIEDLVEHCSEAIYQFDGITDGVKKRQIYKDIAYMESEQGWSVPLEKIKSGRRVYYQYEDKDFSINKKPISSSEFQQIKETISILSRFKGMPQFEWMDELNARFEVTFGLENTVAKCISFQQNPYLEGLHFFTEIFNAIQNKIVLKINYKGFKQEKPQELKIHPYYLKQYNSRWFLYGRNQDLLEISNIALDRIIDIEHSHISYQENNLVDFEDYFDDVVGVTVFKDMKPEKILLEISEDILPYLKSKPIHGSQKIRKSDGKYILELFLVINYELTSEILRLSDSVTVISPKNYRESILTKLQANISKYL